MIKKILEFIGLIILIVSNIYLFYLFLKIINQGYVLVIESSLLILGIETLILLLGIIIGIYILIKTMNKTIREKYEIL